MGPAGFAEPHLGPALLRPSEMSEAGFRLELLGPQDLLPNLRLCCLALKLGVGMGSAQEPGVGVLESFCLSATSALSQDAERRF